jgi:2-polyprenyl-3-methyl-5-hydroxy-6-metoxy-1,4-benzoquinol methylase
MQRFTLTSREMWARGYSGRSCAPAYADPAARCGTFELVRVFRRYLGNGQGRQLLEMGCGGSKYLPWLGREMGFDVEGIDYTPEGCELARLNLAAADVNGTIHCVDFLSLDPEFAGRYDVVTSYGVVEHFTDPVAVLQSFADCLRPGGTMITFVPNMKGLAGRLVKLVDRPLFDTHNLFDLGEFEAFHRRAGLSVVHARYSEWCDFGLVPYERMARIAGLLAKNAAHYLNLARLAVLRRFESVDPQSPLLCSGMIVVAMKPARGRT